MRSFKQLSRSMWWSHRGSVDSFWPGLPCSVGRDIDPHSKSSLFTSLSAAHCSEGARPALFQPFTVGGKVNTLLVHPLGLHPLDQAEKILVGDSGSSWCRAGRSTSLVIYPGRLQQKIKHFNHHTSAHLKWRSLLRIVLTKQWWHTDWGYLGRIWLT